MIKTTLPTVEKSIDETQGKLIVKTRDINVTIDTSLFAEERWEANFPANAKNETLFNYVERINTAGKLNDKAHIMSNLKALYCFMEGDEIADFKSFCQLFDLSDGEYLNKLVDKIKFVFNIALQGSVATPKNS